MIVNIPSGTNINIIDNGSQQWTIMIGYQGQSEFVLKCRDIDLNNGTGLGAWEVLDQFDCWLQAHAAMLDAYNKANGH